MTKRQLFMFLGFALLVFAGAALLGFAVNGGVWFSPDAPFGGYKQSGVGREMGVAGFEEYLETKLVAEGVR